MSRSARITSLLSLLITCAATVGAQGVIFPEPWPPWPPPSPRPQPQPPPTLATRAVVPSKVRIAAEVTGRAARVHLDTTFHNSTSRPMEGTYVLALPAGAVASDLAFHMNGKRIEGELLDAAKAREVYNSIVRRYRDPALLEWAGRDLVKLSLFPIPAGADARVEVVYVQVLPADAGLAELRLPLRVPGGSDGRVFDRQPSADVAVTVELRSERAIGSVYSPTHPIDKARKGEGHVRVGYERRDDRLDRDLTIVFAPARRDVGINALSFRAGDEDGFFLLLITPESGAGERAAKDIVFILDTSGSMRDDDKMAKARRALTFGLRGLGANDRFGVVTFATEARPWRAELASASKSEVGRAISHLEATEATGGTAIDEALEAGLRLLAGTEEDRPRYLVLLTDGLPTVGETDPARIEKRLASRSSSSSPRVFTLGVGYDVNAPLLDGLAARGRGRSQYVKPEEDLEVKVSSFFAKLNHPVLTDIELSIDGVAVHDLYPKAPPDLFHGDDLVVAGRYSGGGRASVTVRGQLRGRPLETERKVDLGSGRGRSDRLPHLAVIWAERKVGYLLEQIRRNGETAELKDEIVRLARAYGLVTPYTSYLVAEDEAPPRRRGARPAADVRRERRTGGGFATGVAPSSAAAKMPQADIVASEVLARPSGREAVELSDDIQRMKESRAAGEGDRAEIRRVGGRRFRLRAGTWVDTRFAAGVDTRRIEAFSEAYFELLDAHPELSAVLALGERVVVVVEGVAYRIEPAS